MCVKNFFDLVKRTSLAMYNSNGFSAVMKKTQVTAANKGQVLGAFTVAPEHLNIGGTLHGGFIASVIDNYTTYTVLKDDSLPGVTVDLCISYLKSAREGDEIIIDAKAIKIGKTLAFIECELRNRKDNTIIAKGKQTMFVGITK